MTRGNDQDNLKLLYAELMPALAKAAVGDFRSDLKLGDSSDPKVNEILVGVQVLLDVINEKQSDLEAAKAQAAAPREPRLTLFDEVLKQPAD
jgi:hypothetical protein